MALAAVACSVTLTLTTASGASAADRVPRCVALIQYLDKGHYHYARLKNLCSKRVSCFTIAVPKAPDVHGRLKKGETKNVRYAPRSKPRAMYFKNTHC
ncbi:hypothetical protein AB0D04_38020 [Streptomyces sp. NPDC048483]|uniref:hypothetical protein n=1 Tax=Streptomyces sp. NPDC048483 TaxID=3154927 RepID=UPI00342C9EB3